MFTNMSTKLYILFSAIIVSLTMVGLFVATSKLQENKEPRSTRSVATTIQANKIHNEPLVNSANKEQDKSVTILNMWYDLAADAETNGVRLDEEIKDARKIGIHSDLLSAIKPGYRLQLPNLIGDDYFLKLGKVERITDTQIQIYGELEDENETYFSTISIIDNTLLAVLSTPKGDYDLKMVDGKGVVYKSEDMNSATSSSVVDIEGFLE